CSRTAAYRWLRWSKRATRSKTWKRHSNTPRAAEFEKFSCGPPDGFLLYSGAGALSRRASRMARDEEERRRIRKRGPEDSRRSGSRWPSLATGALRRRLVRDALAETVRRPQRGVAGADHLPGRARANRIAPAHQPARALHGRSGHHHA